MLLDKLINTQLPESESTETQDPSKNDASTTPAQTIPEGSSGQFRCVPTNGWWIDQLLGQPAALLPTSACGTALASMLTLPLNHQTGHPCHPTKLLAAL